MSEEKPDLAGARARIDAADRAALHAFGERIAAVRGVAAYKAAEGLPVWDGKREAALLERIAAEAPAPLRSVSPFVWKLIMAAARRFEAAGGESRAEPPGRFAIELTSPEAAADGIAMLAAAGAGLTALSWSGTELRFTASRPLPGSLLRDIREHGFHLKRMDD